MSKNKGLVYACIFDGRGSGKVIGWEDIKSWDASQGTIWIHMNYAVTDARQWLMGKSGIDAIYCEALMADEPRPRVAKIGSSLLLILRGVNLNPDSNPEDMVSVRIWVESNRIISLQRRKLMAVQDIQDSLANGDGPRDPGDFLAHLTENLIQRMAGTIEELEDALDAAEDEVLTLAGGSETANLSDIRHAALTLRRYLSPQREVLENIHSIEMKWLGKNQRSKIREVADKTARFTEDLNLIRERAAVIQDEIKNILSQQMNRSIFMLAILSAVLLPMGLVTGLLGINVAGIPGAESPFAFLVVVLILGGLATGTLLLLRLFKII